jgi:hypothetical protein
LQSRLASIRATHPLVDEIIQRGLGDIEFFEIVAIGHPNTFFGDSPNSVLRVTGCAKLSDAQDVQRRAQRSRHLIGNRDAATRQANHHRIVSLIGHENAGQPLSSFMPVCEEHGIGTS